ncbi:glucose/sorbosone dehydrogenase [Antricoccus suffuscus]|uniref:Glucose/sorbosone dehydrogenase n=1 Tax=Antricoccus suffuscus TaxID=1629062 RepID=A0A2T1A544_9ACTN|nr:glucose/sorbosone dehydrogenase [Antricoccus suffuscus]
MRATGLDQPWGIAPLPDGTALVGERATGKIIKVNGQPGVPQQDLFTIPGIDASGDGGLLGLATSPAYSEDGLVFAYITTATDNRVVSFNSAGTVVPVITGIPKGAVHNGGALAAGADGNLYIGTGDTGNPALATDPASLAGKILRIDNFGAPAADNPTAGSAVFASGLADATGICLSTNGGYAVDLGGGTPTAVTGNELETLEPGANYAGTDPTVAYSGKSLGGAACAAVTTTAIVTGLDSKSLMTSIMNKKGAPVDDPQLSLTDKYGRLRAIAIDPASGAMWVGTYNRDGIGTPAADDDKIIMVPPPQGGGGGIS